MPRNTSQFIKARIKELKKIVGKETAICATSGGVDSMVCAALAHRALGKRLIALFIDDGLMREGEPAVVTRFLRQRGMQTVLVKAAPDFFRALKGKTDPEEMRQAFRDTFYKTLGRAVKQYHARYLIQGTIAADIIETKGKVKSQHNVLSQIGINPARYGLTIIEPLVKLFKPEVRAMGKRLGLPRAVYQRMPFPGPGLAARVVGEVTPPRVRIVRHATSIIEQELKSIPAFQKFAVLLNDRATGVKQGRRAFGNIIVIRSVNSKNAMTAKPTRIPYAKLEKIQRRIVRELPMVTKVLYDLSPKPPSTIEYI